MQLHSGEHILSGIVHRRFGYDNVGFHMGADMVTIDFSGVLTEEDLKARRARGERGPSGKTAKSRLPFPPCRSSSSFRTGAKRCSREMCGL